MLRLLLTAIILGLAMSTAQAKIYKWVLSDGTVIYSDKPQDGEGGEEVELSPLQTYSAPPTQTGGAGGQGEEADDAADEGYKEFLVSNPANDTVVRDNGGNVSISLSILPGLKDGHTVDIIVNGQVLGSGRSGSLTLTNLDRGSHTVAAAIRDAAGQEVARASSITFHLKRFAAGS